MREPDGPTGRQPAPDELSGGSEGRSVPPVARRAALLLAVAAVVAAGLWSSSRGSPSAGSSPQPVSAGLAPVDRLFVPDCAPGTRHRVRADGSVAATLTPACRSGIAFDDLGVLQVVDGARRRLVVLDDGTDRGFAGAAGLGLRALLRSPDAVAVAADGAVYVGSRAATRVRTLDPSGVLLTADGRPERSPAGRPAPEVEPARRAQIAVGPDRKAYFADPNSNRVLVVGPDQRTEVVAGTGEAGDAGDGGPATAAALLDPRSVAIDGAGRLYVSEGSGRRVRVIAADGTITSLAGSGWATIPPPGTDVAGGVDGAGQDGAGEDAAGGDGVGRDAAGGDGVGRDAAGGDGGPAALASFRRPGDLAVDGAGTVYVVDALARTVRVISAAGVIGTATP